MALVNAMLLSTMYWMRQDMSRAFFPLTVNQHVPPEQHSATRQMSTAAQGGSPTISVAADQGTPRAGYGEGRLAANRVNVEQSGLSSRLARLMLAPWDKVPPRLQAALVFDVALGRGSRTRMVAGHRRQPGRRRDSGWWKWSGVGYFGGRDTRAKKGEVGQAGRRGAVYMRLDVVFDDETPRLRPTRLVDRALCKWLQTISCPSDARHGVASWLTRWAMGNARFADCVLRARRKLGSKQAHTHQQLKDGRSAASPVTTRCLLFRVQCQVVMHSVVQLATPQSGSEDPNDRGSKATRMDVLDGWMDGQTTTTTTTTAAARQASCAEPGAAAAKRRLIRRDETRVPSRRFGCISSAPAPGICACRTAMPVWAWRPWGCGQGRRLPVPVMPCHGMACGEGEGEARVMRASTGVGVDVVVDESIAIAIAIAMAVFRWAKAGQGQGGGCTGFKACVCGAWRWPNVKVVFFSSRSCLSFSACLSPGCTNLRERLRRWLCDAGGCMGAWGEGQSDAASVARRAACRDGLAACRFLEDGRLAAGPMASSEHRPPQMALGYPRASRVVCRVRGGEWHVDACTYSVVRRHAMPRRAHRDLEADAIGWLTVAAGLRLEAHAHALTTHHHHPPSYPLPQHQYRRALPRKLTILYASNSDCCSPGCLAASPLACPQRG
ncbi:hypothetical protein COCMIDRAFT_25664 [Bipolaris oryzae ATCC 44560]|uniref:Uncharacterized protein n=1 Tax=Bipolaris oryzae ATCC 44560 TaxID=930090 RepID=W6Z3B9_COCMI|nr:uncharacterized protein COCMIDRAFT_25664 [Bipolaris oryzae ATCC 44560]EUC46232.1 hypothetical protein COCMIDRAFT_25664 [Bipolaris oryzae ATCC 44560]